MKTLVGVMMVLHIIVTYTILQQVLVRATCLRFAPGALLFGAAARLQWFAVSTSYLAAAWVVANAVPLFSDIVNITGNLLSTQFSFTLPGILYLCMHWKRQRSAPRSLMDEVFVAGSVAVLCVGAYFTVVGTYSSVSVMVKHAADGSSTVFGCDLK